MNAIKSYAFEKDGINQSLNFALSPNGTFSSEKYSLLDVMADERLKHLSLSERMEILCSYTDDTKAGKHYSYRRELLTGCQNKVAINEIAHGRPKELINLSSNDYLNLSQHARVKRAVTECVNDFGLGIGSAPMLSGTSYLHKKLENKLAALKKTEAAMLFTSGYGANIGTLKALLKENDVAICDMYAHASLMDGCSNTNKIYFKHNDMESLESALNKAKQYKNKLVIVDGVYSMDGDIAKLDQIVEIAHRHSAWVMVDEAHATGVLGAEGRGSAEYYGLEGKIDIISGTFSKALGAVGGFVAGNKELINYLQVACRSYMFSTAPAMPVIAGVIEALNVIEDEPQLRKNLWDNIEYFRNGLIDAGFNIGESETAIIPLIIGDDYKVKEMTHRLHLAGIFVNAVPYPAVPKKLTRVRLSLTSGHTKEQLDIALREIIRVAKELRIIRILEMAYAA